MRRLAPFVLVLVALTACRSHSLALREDDDLRIVDPGDRERVALPVTLRWRGPAGVYAVFVDRAPMPPGKDLDWLARDDDSCHKTPTCPDRAWLNAHGVFLTESRSVALPAIPNAAGRRDRSDDGHRAVVVPLDREGRRHGEIAASRTFLVEGG